MSAIPSLPPVEAWARRLESAADGLHGLLSRPEAAARLKVREGDEDWSAAQLTGHVVEMIPYWTHQCTLLIAAAEPRPFGRSLDSPGRLAGPARGDAASLAELLDELRAAAAGAGAYIRGLSTDDLARAGLHPRRGPMTVADIVELFMVGHLEEHLAQARTILNG
jgi:hypothetical protein